METRGTGKWKHGLLAAVCLTALIAMPWSVAAAGEQPEGVVKEVSEDGVSVTLAIDKS